MKKVLPFLIVWLFTQRVSAQTSSVISETTPKPAPNAAALGKYVDYPIGFYTGTPSISVPLFDINDGAAKVPVSLSYHASGIRVSETSTWVGLGWALNAGGMIIRSVRGGPDEGVGVPNAIPYGYYNDSGLRHMPPLASPQGTLIPVAQTEKFNEFLSSLAAGGSDTEPDLFTFNFNGYSGKFVFDENKIPQLLEQQDLKITVNFGSGIFQSWIVITPDGARYYFGDNSTYEVNKVYNLGLLDQGTMKPSSWNLTKIIYPNTKDTVFFNYTPESYSYCDLGQETAVFADPNTIKSACFPTTMPPQNSLKTIVAGQRLTSIKSSNYTVSFIAKTLRQDLDTVTLQPYPYSLDSVKIYNSQNQCIKQYAIAHNYFVSSTATGASAGATQVTNGSLADTKRLKLLSVQEYSGDGLLSKPAYSFIYQETLQLPRRMSFDQDHWGFSNFSAGNINNRFTPQVSHSICFQNIGQFANREPKWPDMQAFTISSIIDPLGVVTNFQFEAHTCVYRDPSNTVGGLRIKSQKTLDNLTGDSTVRLYDYGSGGVLYSNPNYLIETHNEFYIPLSAMFFSYTGYDVSEFQSLRCLLRQSQSVVPLQDFQGNHIGYGNVKEIFGPKGEGGYKIHHFMADGTMNTSRISLNNYAVTASVQPYSGGSVLQTGIFGNGHFNDLLPANLSYAGVTSGMYWPLAPLQVDFRRGSNMGDETYDSSGVLQQAIFNVYTDNFDESKWIRGFKLFRCSRPSRVESAGLAYNDAMTYYKLRTGISHLTQTVTKNYKDNKVFTTTTTYGYESVQHTQRTSETTVNSQGETLVNKSYYSFDYANTATTDNVFGKLKARNMLLPVATRLWKNNQLLSGTITQFKDFATVGTDTLINPAKVYALDVASSLTPAQAGETVALSGSLPTLIPNPSFIEKANFNYDGTTGKIVEQKLTNDKKQTLIWDNQLQMPMATVDNSSTTDASYSSFETAAPGNWSYTASFAAADATAPTGSNVYTVNGITPLSKTGLTIGKQYILSYWMKTGAIINIAGGTQANTITGSVVNTSWTFKQVTITATATTVGITGSGFIDEVRLYPVNAQMTTYSYDPLLRLKSQCSANNMISQYEYDSFNRLVDIKDQFGNILKAFEYNYGRLSR